MADGSTVCTKCGARMAPVPPGAGTAAAPGAAPQSSGGALKVILIVLGVILALCVAGGIGGVIFLRHFVKSRVHTDRAGNVTSVNLGGTKIETLKDPKLVADKLGVDVYPGAQVVDNQASSVTIGGMTTAHAMFTSNDSVKDVFSFYKQKYPDANVTSEQSEDERTLVQGSEDSELLTIQVRKEDEKTAIHITRITKGKG
jgi:hypothetical protein